jgi:N-acyl-D-aspartate/D-glutamate deacylase
VFDLAAVRDRATYTQPHQLSEGMKRVFVNGRVALVEGHPTTASAGLVLNRRAP